MPGCSWRGHLRGVHIHYCPGVLGGDTCEGHIFITARCSWRGHLREAHIHYSPVFLEGTPARGTYSLLPGVLGGDTCEGYIFIIARVFLEGTLVMGTYGFHYCPSVLGGDTSDGYIVHRFHELSSNRKLDAWHTWYALESKYFKNPFQNDSVRGRSLKADAMVMDAPALPALAGLSGEGQDATTDIRVDRIYPVPVAEVVFPAATVMATLARHGEAIRGIREHLQGVPINEEIMALRFRVEIAEAENASLRGRVRTLEAMDTITHGQEKRVRRRMEQQLASVTETLREMQTKMGALQAQQARAPGPHSALDDADSHT
ncbi:hypothetical protein Tco_1207221 [Tanacetum coccineum]